MREIHMERKHDYRLDWMRAISILLVVLGHSIIIYAQDWGLFTSTHNVPFFDGLKKCIYLVHMPMFTFISGYLFFRKLESKPFLALLRDKAKRVLVPYIVFSFCWVIPIRLLIHFFQYQNQGVYTIVVKGILLGENNGHLWYLIFIFMAYIFSYAFCRLLSLTKINIKWIVILLFILSVGCYAIQNKSSLILGQRLFKKFNGNFVWFCCGLLYHAWIAPLGENSRSLRYGRWFLLAAFIGSFILYMAGKLNYSLPVSIFFVPAAYLFMPDKPCKPVSFLSKNSFGIYLFHSPLVYITFTYLSDIEPVLILLLNFIVFGTLACLLTLLTRKVGLKTIIGE